MMKTMIRKYMAWLVSMLIAMVLFPSCERESFEVTFQSSEANTLTLKLLCNDEEGSRSVDNMDNEDKIVSLDVFLYPETANFETEPIVSKTSISVTADEKTTVNITLSNNEVDALFGKEGESGATDKCRIYVIANRPNTTTFNNVEKYTVNELKALTVTADFAEFTDGQYQKQDNFVMDSKYADKENKAIDVVTLDRQNHALWGTVSLYRAASKITLEITAVTDVAVTDENGNQLYQKDEEGKQETDENGNPIPLVWKATKNAMKVRLNDGVNKTTIDNTVVPYTIQKTDYFSFGSGKDVNLVEAESEGKTFWVHSPAFYSYPMDWSEKAVTISEEPYLTLIVPWVRSDKAQSYESTYYQIPISTITKKLERNTHYHIKLKVSRLGSIVEEKPTIISPSSYIIVPWQTQNVNAYLQDYRYLMVEEKDITIYNEEELYIPYVTSHEAEIVDITCEQMDLSLQIPDWKDANYDKLNLTQKEGYIYFKNTLDNNYKSNTFDFSEYKITFKIRHSDNEGKDKYYETVTITQYPAIYGKAEMNSDWTTTGTNNQKHDNGGYLFVNGHNDDINATPTPDNATEFCSTPGMGGNNVLSWASPNMYVFTISSVEGTNYVIGDPREVTVTYDGTDKKWGNTNENVVWAQGPVLYNGAVYSSTIDGVEAPRTLKNYYGTEKSNRTKDMIAPKFRIASGYAVLSTGANDSRYLEALKMRCASYQEDGYPAGRWRLPTKAEFEFIITQTNKGRLPDIYKDGSTYWCAHGPGTISGTNVSVNENVTSITGNNNGYSARCVYDEWYWTDKLETETQKKVFTWGDQPR